MTGATSTSPHGWLVGIEVFDRWRIREEQTGEGTRLDDGTVGQGVTDPLHRR